MKGAEKFINRVQKKKDPKAYHVYPTSGNSRKEIVPKQIKKPVKPVKKVKKKTRKNVKKYFIPKFSSVQELDEYEKELIGRDPRLAESVPDDSFMKDFQNKQSFMDFKEIERNVLK